MKYKKLYVGLDGGGTYTKAAVSDGLGFYREVSAGSINYNSVGIDRARENLGTIFSKLSDLSGCESFQSVFIGNSAVNSLADLEATRTLTQGIVSAQRLEMDSDLRTALCAMNTEGACAVVISGTGSVVAGRDRQDGAILHAGGWGYILGDEGSAWSIASDALRAAVRGYEKSGEQTLLTEAFIKNFGLSDFEEMVDVFYCPPMERSRIAQLAPIAFACADDGDAAAQAVIHSNAKRLADTAGAVLRELPGDTRVGLYGGVFEHQKSYAELFCRLIEREAQLLPYTPQVGALLEAFRLDGVKIDAGQLRRIT